MYKWQVTQHRQLFVLQIELVVDCIQIEASIKKTKPALEQMSEIKPPRNPSSLMKNAGKFQPNAEKEK